ncbi:LPXTG cell wall anchor domain-containing protein [Streptomyces sparsus]
MKMRTLATAAASTVLVFGMAGPAFAGGDTGQSGGLQISPSSGGPGTHVEVRALCKDGGHGTVASDAFESSQAHTGHHGGHHGGHHSGSPTPGGTASPSTGGHHGGHHGHHNRPFATAKVMHQGLTHGKTYQVTGYCRNHQPMTGTFTYTGVQGGAHAGLGGLASATEKSSSVSSTTTTAAAAAGGLALAGAAGYFVWRRRAGADQA